MKKKVILLVVLVLIVILIIIGLNYKNIINIMNQNRYDEIRMNLK